MQMLSPTAETLVGDLSALIGYVQRAAAAELFTLLSASDLTLTQIRSLHLLDRGGNCSLGDVAEALGISAAAASRAVEGLHRLGLVDRVEDAGDRRVRRLTSTAAGADLVLRLAAVKLAAARELAASLTAAEASALGAALAPIAARPEVAACRPGDAAR